MKLRVTFAIVLLVLTVLLSGVVYGSLELNKERAVGQVQENVDETAVLTAEQIDAEIEEFSDLVGFIASRPEMADFEENGAVIDGFLSNSRFYAAQVVDANGTVVDFRGAITDEHRAAVVGTDASDNAYVQRSLDGDLAMSDPLEREDDEGFVVVISAPIFEDGAVVGAFAAAIDVDRQTFFTPIEPLETGSQTVSIRAAGESLHEGDRRFERHVTSTATIPSTGWQVTVTRDRSALDSQLQFLAIVQGASLLVVLLSVILLGIWEYKVNLAQTSTLLAGFAAIGDGSYDHELSLSTGDEWVQISDGFNELSRRLAEREAGIRERERRLEVLNRVLRHNLRNDITVVLNYATLVEELTDEPDVVKAASTIAAKSRSLSALGTKARGIERAIASVDDGLQPVELGALVSVALSDLRANYPDVELTSELPDELWVTAVGPVSLAIENVLENAAKHNTNPDPTVAVRAERRDDVDPARVALVVIDNGSGIPDHERRVLREGETPLEHGSGLGLWLVYWILEKSNGALRFDDREGGGAIVTLEFEETTPDA